MSEPAENDFDNEFDQYNDHLQELELSCEGLDRAVQDSLGLELACRRFDKDAGLLAACVLHETRRGVK